ncbi:integrase family protein [Methyloceanibacter sp. wino2]|uniref:tyrosine-type recombinase/integrase n=1 Tax=Methyloceanibacter sp. wino2 TaxID=2170729 RepID=UPI000D3E14CE|nr:integrase family protein [Methyloceanibacter sp. wino2]
MGEKPKKRAPLRKAFTDLALRRLKPKAKQYRVWDDSRSEGGVLGLSVLVSPSGTRSFFATYYLDGKAVSKRIGRVGELPLGDARDKTKQLRGVAGLGKDPIEEERKAEEEERKAKAADMSYEQVVDLFIKEYAQLRQRTWKQTQRVLKTTCAEFLKRPFSSITALEAQRLLNTFMAAGHIYKANITRVQLRSLWGWASKPIRKYADAPIMNDLEVVFEGRERERVYTPDELKAIWTAADNIDLLSGAYIKLLLLTAARKSELAGMSLSEIKDGVWTTPHERTKSKKTAKRRRVYLTPLAPLAQRIIKGLPEDFAFHYPGTKLQRKLTKAGAPADFNYHAVRHTVATWFENEGHDDFDRGLVLNHARSGVTAGYSHGYALDRKRALLEKWADHVASIVTAKGAALLR